MRHLQCAETWKPGWAMQFRPRPKQRCKQAVMNASPSACSKAVISAKQPSLHPGTALTWFFTDDAWLFLWTPPRWQNRYSYTDEIHSTPMKYTVLR